jgi:alpha-tubulin suppressor-like RCC1 family protein
VSRLHFQLHRSTAGTTTVTPDLERGFGQPGNGTITPNGDGPRKDCNVVSETGKNLTWTVQLVRLLSILSLFAAGGAAQSVTPKFLYTHQYQGDCGNTGVNAFTVDALTGGVTAVTGSPYVLAGYYPQAAVADPAGRYLWIVNGASTMCANPSPGHGTVTSYRIDPATGALADAGPPGPPQILAVGSGPRSGVTDPAGKYLYVATDCPDETSQPPCAKSAIWGFSISQTDGTLTALSGNPFLTGMSAPASGNVSIAIDGSGQHAYATGNLGVAVFLIDPTTGSLSATGSLYPGPPDAANDLSAQTDPSGRFLVSVVSCNDCSSLADWSIGANGGLTNPITLPISLSPSYPAISPTGPFVYVDANDTSGKGVFEGWKLDTVSGGLSSIDVGSVATFPGGSYSFTSPIADPSGKFLFVTDVTYLNGCSTDQGSIFTFAIDAGSGALTPTPGSPRIFSLDGFSNGAVSSGQIHSGTFSLAGLSVSPSSVSLPAGQNTQLTAVGSLSDRTVEYLTSSSIWSSSNPAVAMVSNAGVLFAGSPGTTEIAACFNSVCGSAPLTVTAGTAPPASISPDSVSFGTGGAQSFILTNNSAASLPVIAIRLSGTDAGDFTETDTCGGALGASSSCSITVSFAPSAPGMRHAELDVFDSCNGILAISTLIGGATLDSIAVTPVSSTVPAGQTLQFTATGTYSDSSTQTITSSVTWSSSSVAIATIDAAGLATGVKVGGPVDIQAALAGISSNKALLTITAPTLVSISVTPMSTVVVVGKTAQFSATGTFSDGSQQNITSLVTWSSSGTAIATIAAGGLATGVKPGSVTITSVLGGASASATLRVLASGLVLTWGPDQYGQLGNGAIPPYSDLPVAVSSIQNAIAVAPGGLFSLAVIADGTVKSWGFNNFGQLGNGGVVNSSVPQPVANLTGVIDVKAGIEFSVALKSDGTVWAWGSNSNGQLGSGTNTESNVPIQVDNLSGVVAISAGWDFAMALKSDGTVWAWGSGFLGELGNAGNADSSVPVPVSGLTRTVAISGGQAQAYALRSDGTVWAWGYNGVGQLGNGTNNNSNVPVPVSVLTGVTAISAGNLSSFALRSDGTVWSWGRNDLGELGNGSTVDTNIPAQITGLSGVSAIAAQGESAQALKSDGSLWAWGYGLFGQLGNGTVASSNVPVPVPVSGGLLALGTGSSADHSIAVVSPPVSIGIAPASASIPVGGKQLYTAVATFGNGATLNVANQVTWSASDPTVATIGQSGLALGLKAGGPVTITATFGRLTSNAASLTVMSAPSGTVVGWGYNFSGQLGNGNTANSNVPVPVNGLTGVISVAAGEFNSLALKLDGTIWAWGDNTYGQLGNGTSSGSDVPIQVPGLNGVLAVGAGFKDSLALKSDGTVWAWGYNSFGQLGDGNTTNSAVPLRVLNLSGVIAISAGDDFDLALKADGTVWAWGENLAGELGNGTTTPSNVPVQVSGLTEVLAISGGFFANHALALRSDGTVWAWGDNTYGELGTGNTISSYSPVQVPNLGGVIAISAGTGFSLALKSDGTVWAWGVNLNGELGNGNNVNSATPVPVGGLNGVVAIANEGGAGLALKSDGTVWTWGTNAEGELGNGNNANSNLPVQVTGLAGVVAISRGSNALHELAIVPPPTVSLTTAVSPAGAGSISPPTGTYSAGSNVLVTVTANPGYLFTGFSGALSGSANPQTLALNSNSTVVANFTPLQPSLTASVGVRTDGPSAGSRNVPLSLLNSGRGAAGNATIASISAITVLGGSGTVTVLSGTPADIGTIAPANSATATVLFSWPTTATRVRFTVNFTADGGYSGSTIITSFR